MIGGVVGFGEPKIGCWVLQEKWRIVVACFAGVALVEILVTRAMPVAAEVEDGETDLFEKSKMVGSTSFSTEGSVYRNSRTDSQQGWEEVEI